MVVFSCSEMFPSGLFPAEVPDAPEEGCFTQAAKAQGFRQRDGFGFLGSNHFREVVRQWDYRPPEMYPLLFRRGDPLRLAPADHVALVLRNKGQNLEHQV